MSPISGVNLADKQVFSFESIFLEMTIEYAFVTAKHSHDVK